MANIAVYPPNSPLPQAVTDDDDCRVPGLLVFGIKQSPLCSLRAKYLEEVGGGHRQVDPFGFVGDREIRSASKDRSEMLKDSILLAPVNEVGGRNLAAFAL